MFAMAYNPSGIVYVIEDPQTSAADQSGIYVLAQNQANIWAPGAKVVVINNVAGAVNNATNIMTVRTLAPYAITGNQVLTSIPNLQLNLDSTANYYFRAVLYTTTGAGGIKVDFGGTTIPVVGSVVAQLTAYGSNAIVLSSQQTSFLSGPSGSASTITQIIIEGYFQTNLGGTFVIQAAQNSSNAAATTILQGSSLTVTQVP
jgi:hypothetical protein